MVGASPTMHAMGCLLQEQRRGALPRVAFAVALAVAASTLQGCEDGTCMWDGDIMVKGCRDWNLFFDWSSCIEHCNGCFDECNKLMCAAYCAKASGSEQCRSNYETLCTNAINNVGRVGS